VRSFSFVFMIVLFAACGFFAGYPAYITAYGISIGLSATLSSFLLSVSMLGNVASKLAMGIINDKLGGKFMVYTALGISLVTLILLINGAGSLILMFIGAFLAGNLLTLSSVTTPLMIHTVYGSRDYTRIFLLLSLSQNTFVSFGPSIIGFMFDTSGGYEFSFIVGIVLTVVTAGLVYFAFLTGKKLTWS